VRKPTLRSVPDPAQPRELAGDIYADTKARVNDPKDKDRWARVHIEADKRNLPRRWWW
jgi:hypothetical protein